MSLVYLEQDLRVTFTLEGKLPIWRERYVSPQAGTVVLKGFFNQSAHMETPNGTRYRTLSPRKDEHYLGQMAYPVIRLPDKAEICRLRTPIKLQEGLVPRLRFTTTLDDQQYVFRQISPGRRGFELWDGMEMQRLVRRELEGSLVADMTVLVPVPAVLILLFPWLDNQIITYTR